MSGFKGEHIVEKGINPKGREEKQSNKRKNRIPVEAENALIISVMIILIVARQLTMKTCANRLPAHIASGFSGVWVVSVSVLALPFFWEKLIIEGRWFYEYGWLCALSFFKGVVLWGSITLNQHVRKASLSSAMFIGPVSLGFIATVNAMLGENLNMGQWGAILLLFSLGWLFFLRGHAQVLNAKERLCFAGVVVACIYFNASDFIVITQLNWYVHMLLSGCGMLSLSVFTMKAGHWKTCFVNRDALTAGATWGISEAFILAVRVTILPVTIATLVTLGCLPLVMLLCALLYGEGRPREQIAFGIGAFILSLPFLA